PNQDAEAAGLLGRAFVNDALIKAILPPTDDSTERALRMGQMFAIALASQRSSGQPVAGVLHEGRVGAAAILEQVERPPPLASIALDDLVLLPAMVRGGGIGGLRRVAATLDVLCRNRPAAPHLYLNVLGVEPALQGNHFGVALLDWLREQAAMKPDLIG